MSTALIQLIRLIYNLLLKNAITIAPLPDKILILIFTSVFLITLINDFDSIIRIMIIKL